MGFSNVKKVASYSLPTGFLRSLFAVLFKGTKKQASIDLCFYAKNA